MTDEQTLVDLMRKASELVGLSIKTGAAAPAREAIAIHDRVIEGDYERVTPTAMEKLLDHAEKRSDELTQDANGDDDAATKPKARASKPKAKAKRRAKKSRS